eukprot:CAMPEP_0196197692 /NCGR_PEP_ID=MMETSP0912-20130531/2062_1 /TAXON_ID=49265 /ORGANISM="Thalassiosira rotula, Strain GSO102" /LENGTH=85 /DNA_ID=CAMNT_0041470613 /DNA_START=58 /DNA_END=316 /DNA_ORIENTATION=+
MVTEMSGGVVGPAAVAAALAGGDAAYPEPEPLAGKKNDREDDHSSLTNDERGKACHRRPPPASSYPKFALVAYREMPACHPYSYS